MTKKCSKCQIELPFTDFYKNRSNKSGYQDYCKSCLRLARVQSYQRSSANTLASNRSCKIKRVYKITQEEYNVLLFEAQENGCAICGSKTKPHLDHNHETGQLREFLCSNCNLALGLLKEDPERMERMAAYVRKHEREEKI